MESKGIYSTEVIKADLKNPDPLVKVSMYLKHGEVAAIPTETVYGLAGNALDSNAVKKVFEAKGRPVDNPVIVHISKLDMLSMVSSNIPNCYRPILDAFFPGPLTILLKKSSRIPDCVTGGSDIVAVRMPSHPVAQYIIEQAGVPVVMPSANKSGGPSPTSYKHVLNDLDGLIPFIVDGGPSSYGLESTVINLLTNPPSLLRPGAITLETLRKYVPNIQEYKWTGGEKPLSPGLMYKHYSPNAKLILIDILNQKISQGITNRVKNLIHSYSKSLGILKTHTDDCKNDNDKYTFICGTTAAEIAKSIFKGLRYLDSLNVDYILFSSISKEGEGLAVMDRIKRASSIFIHNEEDLEESGHLFNSLFKQ